MTHEADVGDGSPRMSALADHPLLTRANTRWGGSLSFMIHRWPVTLMTWALMASPAIVLAFALGGAQQSQADARVVFDSVTAMVRALSQNSGYRVLFLVISVPVTLGFTLLISAAAYRYFLGLGATPGDGRPASWGRFITLTVGLFAAALLTPLAIGLTPYIVTSASPFSGNEAALRWLSENPWSFVLAPIAQLGSVVLPGVLYCLFGTAFAASADGGDAGLGAAWARVGGGRLLLRLLTALFVSVALIMTLFAVISPLIMMSLSQTAQVLALGGIFQPLCNIFLLAVIAATVVEHYLRRERLMAQREAAKAAPGEPAS